MTEAEYLEAISSLSSNMTATYAIFISVVGGYLVVAYNVGTRISSAQLWIINTLYLVTTSFVLLSIFETIVQIQSLALELAQINSKRTFIGIPYGARVTGVINLFVLAASIKFMADIRKNSDGEST
jgi:hypothetical protein